MNNRYEVAFAELKEKNQGAFVPFVTLGDPNLATSLDIIKTLIDAGADALELGFPFSDPIADGPVIQDANIRALAADVTTSQCFELIAQVREYAPKMPIGLLLYSNLVFARGIDAFYATAKKSGVDSVLIADVPIRESEPFRTSAAAHGVDPIFIAAPNSPQKTLKKVAEYGRGYTYMLSRAGVTGTDTVAEMPASELIEMLEQFNCPPGLLGFGISTPAHVKQALASGAKGTISGSAVVKIIANNLDDKPKMLSELSEFVVAMKAATGL
ncbi:MAG: tryptophan synthase alpha chain [Phenylobacterium sp.]|jgi:tryptophan synthase alpha chain